MKYKNISARLYKVREACDEINVSRNTLMKLALDAGAIVKIGTRNVRIDMPKLYKYLELCNTVTEK